MYKSIVTAIVFLFVSQNAPAQDFLGLKSDLVLKFEEMVKAASDKEKMKASEELVEIFEQCFNFPESFTDPFEALKNIGFVMSPDRAFRIINWNVPLSDYSHHFEGFVLFPLQSKTGKISYERLKYSGKKMQKPETKYLDADQWTGALYYEIVPVKTGKKTIYTLLGWRGIDRLTSEKIIEVLDISGKTIRFGAPIFKMEKSNPKRLIFEYNAEVQMSLRYSPKDKMIVYDHLSPMQPGMEGNYAFYGPDLSFDALEWEKGKWVHRSNVDVRMGRDPVKRPYSDPRQR